MEYVPNACHCVDGIPLGHVCCEGQDCVQPYNTHRTALLAGESAPLARAMFFCNDRSNSALRRHAQEGR
jgi:hypothetical protein